MRRQLNFFSSWSVELRLLVVLFVLLLANRREAKSREAPIEHFTSVADVITRQEYFVAVVDMIECREEPPRQRDRELLP